MRVLLRYALALVAVALAAAIALSVGPLVAHPPTGEPSPPPEFPQVSIPPPPPAFAGQDVGGAPNPIVLWILAGLFAALLLVIVIRRLIQFLRAPRRIRAGAMPQARPGLTPELLGLADEVAGVDVEDGRHFDPQRSADDIIATWAALERAAEQLDAPRRSAQTPTEFLLDCVARWGGAGLDTPGDGAARDSRAATLLTLYHRARFDTAELGIGAATSARDAARSLIVDWQQVAAMGAG